MSLVKKVSKLIDRTMYVKISDTLNRSKLAESIHLTSRSDFRTDARGRG